MKVSEVYWPAVRAYRRIIAPIYMSHEEARRYDAGFDAGEWSGPAHDRMFETEDERVQAMVADRFGIDRSRFASMVYVDAHHEESCWMDANVYRDKTKIMAKAICNSLF